MTPSSIHQTTEITLAASFTLSKNQGVTQTWTTAVHPADIALQPVYIVHLLENYLLDALQGAH